MVFLIGGSSHVGKTLLSQKLMEKLQVPYFSLDYLKMGLIRAGMTELTAEQDAAMRDYMWPLVREIIKTAVEGGRNLIIEGCYIPGDWAKSFSQPYLEDIRSAFIVMSEMYIRSHAEEIVRLENIIESRRPGSVNIERLVSCSAMFENWAKENNCPCLKIDSVYDAEELAEKLCDLMGM